MVYAISFQKQPISYSLLINPSSLFGIHPETGEISLTRTLDYESDQRRYLLMVRASEESGSLSAAAEVRLTAVRRQQQAVLAHVSVSLAELFPSLLFKHHFKGRPRLELSEEFKNQLAESGMQVVNHTRGKTRPDRKQSYYYLNSVKRH